MRRLLIFLLGLCCFLLVACQSDSPVSTTPATTDSEEDTIVDAYTAQIYKAFPAAADVEVSDSDDDLTIRIMLSSNSDIADFGIHAYNALNACTEVMEDNPFTVLVFWVDLKQNSSVTFSNVGGKYGMILDNRSGTSQITYIDSAEELADIFPKLKSVLRTDTLDQTDVALYNEVMKILSSDMSRKEEDIITEIAPDYNMSADEMTWFLKDMLNQQYGGSATPATDDNTAEVVNNIAVEADSIIYNTPASENGLEDIIMFVTGKVYFAKPLEAYSLMEITTGDGVINIMANNELFAAIPEIIPELDESGYGWHNWRGLKDGDTATVYFYYIGYSAITDTAAGIFIYAEPIK